MVHGLLATPGGMVEVDEVVVDGGLAVAVPVGRAEGEARWVSQERLDLGLREDVAEDLPGPPARRDGVGERPDRALEQRFPDFWTEGSRFQAPLAGIAPGEVALIEGALCAIPRPRGVD